MDKLDIFKLKSSKKLALFLGMLVGDGCLPIKHNGDGNRVYPVLFYNTNKSMTNLFHSLFYDLFFVQGKIRYRERSNKKPLWYFEKYSKEIYNLLHIDYEISNGKKAVSGRIPSFIRNEIMF
jgi:hypothetical protein